MNHTSTPSSYHEVSIDAYYSKVFLESHISKLSGNILRVESYADIQDQADASVYGVVLDRFLNRTYEYERVIREVRRVLVSGGMVLCTLSSIAPRLNHSEHFWGFTVASARYLFGKYFGTDAVQVTSFGNVLSGRMLLEGVPAAKLKREELEYTDPFFPVVVGVCVRKK